MKSRHLVLPCCLSLVGLVTSCAGESDDTRPALALVPLVNAVQVSVGDGHRCAVLADHSVACWGAGAEGQLGVSVSGGASDAAQRIPNLPPMVEVSAGAWHTCAVSTEGELWCWGLAGKLAPEFIEGEREGLAPFQVRLGARVRHVSCGAWATCATTDDGLVHCWGQNTEGEVGPQQNETCGAQTSCVQRPSQPVMTQPVTALAAGRLETCAIQAGELWCWGVFNWRNADLSFCEIGDSHCMGTPTPVPGLTNLLHVAEGSTNGCAASSDTVYCWGRAYFKSVDDPFDRHPTSPQRVPLAVVDLAVTEEFECGLSPEGAVLCWGDVPGEQESVPMEAPVTLEGAGDVVAISGNKTVGGGASEICGIRRSGGVICWRGAFDSLETEEPAIWLPVGE